MIELRKLRGVFGEFSASRRLSRLLTLVSVSAVVTPAIGWGEPGRSGRSSLAVDLKLILAARMRRVMTEDELRSQRQGYANALRESA